MELDVSIDKESVSVTIQNPFRLDLDAIMARVDPFLASQRATQNGLDMRGLLPHMVKGIAGCEAGCPANAKSLVERGFKNFSLQYVEGGILTAQAAMTDGRLLTLKLFPDF